MATGTEGAYQQRLAARKRNASIFYGVCVAAVIVALLMLVALLYSVISEAIAWLNLDGTSVKTLLTDIPSSKAVSSGLFPAIVGTVWVMGICIFVSFTVGVSSAIYLEEYSGRSRIAGMIQTNIQNLAAVPSIVYGILGLSIFVAFFVVVARARTARTCRRRA